MEPLKYGQVLFNQEICNRFQCAPQGGMRRSIKTNTLVIITDQTKLYKDLWKGDILQYTGMGMSGDQNFHYRQNRTLYESRTNGVALHLFEVLRPREYTYRGMVELAGEPYVEKQLDMDQLSRTVCMFPLRVIEESR